MFTCTNAKEIIKVGFYEELETTVTGYPKNNIKILQGNFHDKVWFKVQDSSAVGNCRLHEESNDNGLTLFGLVNILNMVKGNITPKKIHLIT
jgi:hypothetical protein